MRSAAGATVNGGPQRVLAHVRRGAIVTLLRQTGSVTVADVATRFAVSEMTIRRDLMDLEREGHLARTHGGAVALHGVAMDREEPSFDMRLGHHRPAKEIVAGIAASLIGTARTVALDVGATTFLLSEHLRGRTDLNIFTTSLRIALALADTGLDVFVPGGRVRGTEMAIGGSAASEAFAQLWFDVAFIGVSGVTANGLYDYSIEDTEIKRVYLRRSTLKVVLCDASKFQRMSLVRVAGFDAVDALVTDAEPPPPIAAALREAGVAVHLAPTP